MSILIHFQRKTTTVMPAADTAERMASIFLAPLRLACGRTVEVSYESSNSYVEKKPLDLISQIFFGAIAFLLFPAAIIGALCVSFSKSHQAIYQHFIASRSLEEGNRLFTSLQERFNGWVQAKAKTPLSNTFLMDLMKEAVTLYGPQALEKNLFSSAHEQKILRRIAQFHEIIRERETPVALAYEKILENQETAPLLIRLEEQIGALASQPIEINYPHLTEISHLQNQMREQINAEELRHLEHLLIETVGEELAHEILQDWDYIGLDIRDNTTVLSSERKEKILKKARQAQQDENRVQEILNQLKIDLAKDLLPQEKFVFQRYGALPDLLTSLPKSKIEILHQTISQMMAQALVTKELRSMTAFIAPKDERNVVKALGLSLESYDEREKIHTSMKILLSPLLQESNLPSVDKLRQTMKDTACHTRLRAAGASENQITSIRLILLFYTETKESWISSTREATSSLEIAKSIHLPLAREKIKRSVQDRNEKIVLSFLTTLLKKNQKELFTTLQRDAMQVLWQDRMTTSANEKRLIERCKKLHSFQQSINWFAKYQDLFIHEFSQGNENSDEALGDGVCYALCHRLAKNVILHPDLPIEELKIDCITPADRLLQAAAGMHKDQDRMIFMLPPKVCKKQGMKQIPLFFTSGILNIIATIVDQIGNLKRSNGGILLGRASHQTFLCLDDQHNRFFFFDPNFGTLAFQLHPKETVEELAARMALCYEELYAWAYNSKDPLFATRLIPMEPGEKAPLPWNIERIKKAIKIHE
jgi:hypothetical protein